MDMEESLNAPSTNTLKPFLFCPVVAILRETCIEGMSACYGSHPPVLNLRPLTKSIMITAFNSASVVFVAIMRIVNRTGWLYWISQENVSLGYNLYQAEPTPPIGLSAPTARSNSGSECPASESSGFLFTEF